MLRRWKRDDVPGNPALHFRYPRRTEKIVASAAWAPKVLSTVVFSAPVSPRMGRKPLRNTSETFREMLTVFTMLPKGAIGV